MKQIMRFTAILVTAALLASAMSQPAFAESEPNDVPAQATSIGIGYQNAETNASISSATDKDYYRFDAEAGRTYVIETYNIQATSNNLATGLYLYNASNALLAQDQYGQNGISSSDARITYQFATSGTYYLLVTPRLFINWTGAYSLRILPKYDEPGAGWNASNDYEPNDSPVNAFAIGVGLSEAQIHQLAPHEVFTTHDSDHDYYRFTAEAGRTYVIQSFNIQATANNQATGLYLYNSTGSLLANDQYGQTGRGGVDAQIIYQFATSGTYFILVKRRLFSTWTGTYSLRILPKHDEPGAAWDAANDYEPNDVKELANMINFGCQNAQTHQLAPHTSFTTHDSDYDFYAFPAQAGETWIIETFNIPNDSTAIFLYNATGSELANDQYGSNGSGAVDARITYKFATPGTYYIAVKDRTFTDWTGTYSVRVLDSACGFRVYVPTARR